MKTRIKIVLSIIGYVLMIICSFLIMTVGASGITGDLKFSLVETLQILHNEAYVVFLLSGVSAFFAILYLFSLWNYSPKIDEIEKEKRDLEIEKEKYRKATEAFLDKHEPFNL